MPRLKKELVIEREAFAKNCFRRGLSVEDTNKELAKVYAGMKMALPRLAELYTETKLDQLVEAKHPEIIKETPKEPVKVVERFVSKLSINEQVQIRSPEVSDFEKYALDKAAKFHVKGKHRELADLSDAARAEYERLKTK